MFSHKGNPGITEVNPNEVLGLRREETHEGGVRHLKCHQAFKVQEIWNEYGQNRQGKRAPNQPFPTGHDHPQIDNTGRVAGVTEQEASEVHKKGYREVIGSILWISRNSAPMIMYSASILSKCLSTPPISAWNAAMHVIHYLHKTKDIGITYNSNANLEPVLYYDSGFNQRKLCTHPQYSFVIFWAGAPILWRSKRHPVTPSSVAEAEFQCLAKAWSHLKWIRELLTDLGMGEYVKRPTLCCGDNRNARDWAQEYILTEGNQHLDRQYFIVRERTASGDILPIWIPTKDNPADVGTKAIDGTVANNLEPYMSGQKEIPIPSGYKIYFGPLENPVLRGNK